MRFSIIHITKLKKNTGMIAVYTCRVGLVKVLSMYPLYREYMNEHHQSIPQLTFNLNDSQKCSRANRFCQTEKF